MKLDRRPARSKANRQMGSLAGWMLRLFAKNPKSGDKNPQKAEFKTSTQRMGLRFSEKIRDTFRNKWLKKR